MKIAVVGSNGYIAGYIVKRLSKQAEMILKIDKSLEADVYLDLEQPEEFAYDELREIDYVIFTAAISGPDQCAAEYKHCWRINVTGTEYFIAKALEQNCRIIFFSSDAVFGEDTGDTFTEESKTQAFSAYGRMKKAVEDTFCGNPLFKVIRLSYVVSARDKFVQYCLNCMRENRAAEVFHPFYRNCITVSDVVDVVEVLCMRWDECESRVFNVAGRELISRVRIADELKRYFGDAFRYEIICPKDEFYANRTRITQMKSLYMEQYHLMKTESFTEKIRRELEDIRI